VPSLLARLVVISAAWLAVAAELVVDDVLAEAAGFAAALLLVLLVLLLPQAPTASASASGSIGTSFCLCTGTSQVRGRSPGEDARAGGSFPAVVREGTIAAAGKFIGATGV
jgi:hypothetical protein